MCHKKGFKKILAPVLQANRTPGIILPLSSKFPSFQDRGVYDIPRFLVPGCVIILGISNRRWQILYSYVLVNNGSVFQRTVS